MLEQRGNISRLILFVALAVVVGVGMFIPFKGFGGFLVQATIFLLVSCLIYVLVLRGQQIPWRERIERDDEEEKEESGLEEIEAERKSWPGFSEAYREYYGYLFPLLRRSLMATSAAIYMGSESSGLRFYCGEEGEGIIEEPVPVEEGSVIETVYLQNLPLWEGNLPRNTDLPGLDESMIRSLLAVPLVMEDRVVGVLAAGNETEGHFGEDDIEILSGFSQLLVQMMAACHVGLRWEAERKIYHVFLGLTKQIQDCFSREEVLVTFATNIRKLFAVDRLTLCRKENDQGIIEYVFGQIDAMDRESTFPLDGGLNGWMLKRNAPLVIGDIEEGRFIRPRYQEDEDSKHGLHSFLGLPLCDRDGNVWGCISVESKMENQYGEQAKEILSLLAVPLNQALERVS